MTGSTGALTYNYCYNNLPPQLGLTAHAAETGASPEAAAGAGARAYAHSGSRPHRCSTLAIPLLLLHQQAELLYKNINNHLTTFGTKLNLRAHTNIKHYIIYTKNFNYFCCPKRCAYTILEGFYCIYIYMYSITQHLTVFLVSCHKNNKIYLHPQLAEELAPLLKLLPALALAPTRIPGRALLLTLDPRLNILHKMLNY